jgi:hypothetical protein
MIDIDGTAPRFLTRLKSTYLVLMKPLRGSKYASKTPPN